MNHVAADRLVKTFTGHAQAQECPESIEWEPLVRLAIEHGMAPWFYNRVRAGTGSPPQAILGQLRESYLANAARGMGLFHELRIILRAFNAEGIPAIPLKGACLAEAVYGDIALRPMTDIDLLVKPAEMPRALTLFRKLGYDSEYPFDRITEQSISQHMPLLRKGNTVVVELHWTIVCPAFESRFTAADLAALWSRAVPDALSGVPSDCCPPRTCCFICASTSRHNIDLTMWACAVSSTWLRLFEIMATALTGRPSRRVPTNGALRMVCASH